MSPLRAVEFLAVEEIPACWAVGSLLISLLRNIGHDVVVLEMDTWDVICFKRIARVLLGRVQR